MVEDQQIGTAIQSHIRQEGTLGGVEIGEGRPARAGGGAGGNREAGQRQPLGQQLAGIEHLAAAAGEHGIRTPVGGHGLQPAEIRLAAVVTQHLGQGFEPRAAQVFQQPPPQRGGGSAASQQQRSPAERGDPRQGFPPGSFPPQHPGRGDGVLVQAVRHQENVEPMHPPARGLRRRDG
jgi:hypothetical protein